MTNTTDLLEAAKNKVNSLHHNVRCAYVNGMALRSLVQEKEKHFLFNLCEHPAPEVLKIPNGVQSMYNFARASMGSEFGTLKVLLDLAEASAEFKEAYQLIQPMVDEVARLEELILEEQRQYGQKIQAIREAEEAAIAKAQTALEKDPAIQKLREQAEQARPAHIEAQPFRGRVKLEVASV